MADNVLINAVTTPGGATIATDEVNGVQHELVKVEGERQVEVVTKVRDELERLIEENLNGDLSRIDELIDLINSKDYKPEIVINSSSKSEIKFQKNGKASSRRLPRRGKTSSRQCLISGRT